MTYTTRLCTIHDQPELFEIVNSHDRLWGSDIIDNGVRITLSYMIRECLNSNNANVVCAEHNGQIAGFSVQVFRKNDPIWYYKFIMYRKEYTRDAALNGALWDMLIDLAEERGLYEYLMVNRGHGGHREWTNAIYNASKYLNKIYNLEIVDFIPPGGKSKFAIVNDFLLGITEGTNKKNLVVRHGYLANRPEMSWPATQDLNLQQPVSKTGTLSN